MELEILKHKKNIIFDFDGVIIDSMSIRTDGFRDIFNKYDNFLVEKLVEYHNINGGLSRFNKIKYFYNELLKQEISEERIQEYADEFSLIMRDKLTSKKVLIIDTVKFIKENYSKNNMHIASGSEEKELQFLCEKLEISHCFKSIKGSPIHKNELVKMIIKENNYDINETIIIGDSINDFEAAQINNIGFLGYNNPELKNLGLGYIENF